MSFMQEMERVLAGDTDFNTSTTENGALGYRTTGKSLLDLNFSIPSFRSADEKVIIDKWTAAYEEDPNLALKFLFFARDIRGGLGERRFFRVITRHLAKTNEKILNPLLVYISEYGRWDDLIYLIDCGVPSIEDKVVDIVRRQLRSDADNMKFYPHQGISLLAKWMPSINTSSSKTVKLANILAKKLELTAEVYRKMLSKMRAYSNVLETMVHGQWGGINYSAVPSKANLKYKEAFLRHDRERRNDYLLSLKAGETKINAGVLYPYEIVSKYVDTLNRIVIAHRYDEDYSELKLDPTLEELWKALPNLVDPNSRTIVVADGSGSMETNIYGTRSTLLDVANSIAIYFAEKLTNEFANKYITFSEHPRLVNLGSETSLAEKIITALKHSEISNTNVEAVFDLILETAIQKHMNQEDIPSNILIISDMEFDEATSTGEDGCKKLFQIIRKKYENAGYKLPKLIFWNVGSRTNTIPVIENPMGLTLVSGFSIQTVKMVMSGEIDPWKVLLEAIMAERYAPIKIA